MGFAKKSNLTRTQIKKLMLEDLNRSGISEVVARHHKFEPLTADETFSLTEHFAIASYKLPYPDDPEYFRLRFLELAHNGRKQIRYWQPPGTPPSAFFAKCAVIDWPKLRTDPTVEVYLTEGEKKAISGCQTGTPVIGLGGVWAFKAEKWNMELLPALDSIQWQGRRTTLVFDSDIVDKKEVQQALASLARELAKRGAEVVQALLPPEHKGLDDYIVAGGALEDLEVFSVYEHLEELNTAFVYVRSEQKVLAVDDLRTGCLSRMCVKSEAAQHYARHAQAPHFKEWNSWNRRNEVGGFTYRPGHEHFSEEFPDEANIWVAPTLEPKRGSTEPWQRFMKYLMQLEPTALDYLTWWLGMTVVRPDVKVRASPVLWSEAQGTGKSLCFELMRPLVGKHNFGVPSLSSVASNFNSWLERKKLLLLNEAYDSADRAISNALKDIQTADYIEINAKYRTPYHVPNFAHLAITSNKPTPVYITKADRRHYVVRTPDHKLDGREYQSLLDWWHSEGARHVLWYFQNKLDLTRFNPNLEPPPTQSKLEMVEANYTEAERILVSESWAKDWARRCDLLEMSQLMVYVHAINPKVSETQVRNSLHRLGARHERLKIKGSVIGLWAVRNFEHWRTASKLNMRTHVEENNPNMKNPSAVRRRLRNKSRK